MKRMKKLASLFLAMVMVLSMTVAAFAEGETTEKDKVKDFVITLENKNAGHTYKAYQVFTGDLLVENKGTANEKKTLSNVEWATGVKTTEAVGGKTLIAAINEALGTEIDANASARDVANALAKQMSDSEKMQKFVKAIKPFLGSEAATSEEVTKKVMVEEDGKQVEKDVFDGKYTISGLEAGYYLVEDAEISGEDGDAYSRYMLEVVADVKTQVKAEVPEITKKILEGNDKVDANTAGVGELVSYEITGNVPQHESYVKYYYVISDTLSPGLDFQNDIKVKVGSNELTEGTDYRVYTQETNPKAEDGITFEVAFLNVKGLTAGEEISVTYSAKVNSNAVVGSTGNPNEVTLKYSNNPNRSEEGDKEEKPGYPDPDKGVVTGDTPKDITVTYLAQVDIVKTFKNSNGDPITGDLPEAQFTISGTSTQTLLTGKDYYVENPDGKYYLLIDNTYTAEIPVEPEYTDGVITNPYTSDQYVKNEDGSYKKYEKKTTTELTTIEVPVYMTGKTDKDGKLTFKGLGEGTYVIEETKVPDGFNKAPNMTIVITAKIDNKNLEDVEIVDGNEKVTWDTAGSSEGVALIPVKNGDGEDAEIIISAEYAGIYQTQIENRAGSLLPSTGGIGRTIFYAAGIILMAGAMFFVVRRKRA